MTPRDDLPAAVALLLEGAVDYAGLFPPAALSMGEAIANYAAYRSGSERWALGRLIVAGSRLGELTTEIERLAADINPDGWRVSITLGANQSAEIAAGVELNRAGLGIVVDAVEAKVASPRGVAQLAALTPTEWACFGEVPLDESRDPVLDELKSAGVAAKIRMGGVTPEAFPSPEQVAGFLIGVVSRSVPFKATAGLHHPMRGRYRLTYDVGSQAAPMYGYLNVMVATLLAVSGADEQALVAALVETDGRTIETDAEGMSWRGYRFPAASIALLRRQLYQGFGSCSFREPLDELRPALAV